MSLEKPQINKPETKPVKEKIGKFFRVMVLATAASVSMAGYGAETAHGQSRRSIGRASRTAENLYGELSRQRQARQIEKLEELDREIELLERKFKAIKLAGEKEIASYLKLGKKQRADKVKEKMIKELEDISAEVDEKATEADKLEKKIMEQKRKDALISTIIGGFRRIMRDY